MDRRSSEKRVALAAVLCCISGLFGCGAASSSGSPQTQQNLTLASASVNFGTVVAGANAVLADTVTNNSTTNVTINSASASIASFKIASPALPLTLSPGQSTPINISFSPQAAGKPTGTVTLSSGAGQLQIAVSGTAVSAGSLTVSPASVSFGNVVLGKSQTQSVALTNAGGSPVTISQASVSSASFSITGLSLPVNLAPGQSTNFGVLFTPTTAGNVSGSVAVAGSASLSTSQTAINQSTSVSASVSMSGDGIPSGQLSVAPGSLDFGNVQIGKTQTQTATLTNSSGNSVTISKAVVSGSGFSLSGLSLPANLAAGASTSFSVTFAPSTSGTVNGSVAFTSDATNPSLGLPLTGTGNLPGSLTANPATLSFGSVQVGNSRSLSETLTNTGGATINLTNAAAVGTGFSISGLSTPTQLSAGQSVTFSVLFAPKSAGTASGSVNITSNAPNPSLAIALGGTGTASGQLSVNPSSLNFGNVTVGASKNLTSTVTASGASVTISSATSNSTEFGLSGLSLPTTLVAGQSATFTVTFAPQASGSATGNLTFASNAANASPVLAGTGTGVAPVQHSASLTWQASSSAVTGYNVYRGTQSGGPYAVLNSALIAPTDYTDSTVSAGNTYYYVVTSVDSQGVESVQSNQVQAVIPSP
jgi:hypothetical protein